MMIHFWENTFWAKTSLFFVFRGAKLSAPWGFQVWWSQWYKFQSCMMIHFWENTFWHKTSLFFVFRVPNSVHPEVFRSWWSQWYKFQSCMMIHFWKEKHILRLKHHFSLYLEGQTQCTLRFSGVMITMVQVSKLYDDPFLKKKHILG